MTALFDLPELVDRSPAGGALQAASRSTMAAPSGKAAADSRKPASVKAAYHLIVIGCSLGGMKALERIFHELPAEFPVPIAVVQHRHRTSAEGLPAFLRKSTKLSVVDADDKQWIRPGTIYLAPADYHLMVERGEFSLSVDAAVSYSRPSIDVLFESAADSYQRRLVGVVLTGSNQDGTRGIERIKQRGGFVVAQDPATAEAPEMPRAAIDSGRVDRILPLDRIGPYLIELCRVVSDP